MDTDTCRAGFFVSRELLFLAVRDEFSRICCAFLVTFVWSSAARTLAAVSRPIAAAFFALESTSLERFRGNFFGLDLGGAAFLGGLVLVTALRVLGAGLCLLSKLLGSEVESCRLGLGSLGCDPPARGKGIVIK